MNRQSKRRRAIARRAVQGLKLSGAIGSVMLLSSTLILGYDFLTQLDFLKIEAIEVEGGRRLSTDSVIHQAQVTRGANILSVNLSTTRKRLLAHPSIAEVRVKRRFPSGILLSIREHEPLAILDLGRKFIINTHGSIFREVDPSLLDQLPVINGLEFTDISAPGQPFSASFTAVMEVLRLGSESGSVVPNRAIESIRVDRETGLTVYTRDQVKAIRLGYSDFHSKFDRLRNVLYHLRAKPGFADLDFIDLNNLDRIVVNPSRVEPPADTRKEV